MGEGDKKEKTKHLIFACEKEAFYYLKLQLFSLSCKRQTDQSSKGNLNATSFVWLYMMIRLYIKQTNILYISFLSACIWPLTELNQIQSDLQ